MWGRGWPRCFMSGSALGRTSSACCFSGGAWLTWWGWKSSGAGSRFGWCSLSSAPAACSICSISWAGYGCSSAPMSIRPAASWAARSFSSSCRMRWAAWVRQSCSVPSSSFRQSISSTSIPSSQRSGPFPFTATGLRRAKRSVSPRRRPRSAWRSRASASAGRWRS